MKWLKWLDEVLWPRGMFCLCCEAFSHGRYLCPDCSAALQAMRLPETEQTDGCVRSVFRYDGIARILVRKLKWECQTAAAEELAVWMAEEIDGMNLPENTVLTWVTMPKIRKWKRGIDHGYVLCEAVSMQTGYPVEQLLVRKGNGHTQRGLNRNARLKNISRSIGWSKPVNKPVLLIDDVLTTGATVAACTEALRQAGAPQIFVVTATRAVLKNRFTQIM